MRSILIAIVDRLRKYKIFLVPFGEIIIFVLILPLSYIIRLGFIEDDLLMQIVSLVAIIVPIKILLFCLFKLYHISFRYTSLYEIMDIFKASLLAALCFSMLYTLLRDAPFFHGFPRSIIIIDFMLTFIIASGDRMFFRILYFPYQKLKKHKRVLVVGAGLAGEQLVREMQSSSSSNYYPIAFCDDDPNKKGSIIHGIRIVGGQEEIPRIIKDREIEEVIIAIPSATSIQIKNIMNYIRKSDIKNIKILPGLAHILDGIATLKDIKEIDVEDLLGREAVKIDLANITSYLENNCILVTGAGGSIGSELCRQIALYKPGSLIILDIGETELFYVDNELKEKFPKLKIISKVADIRDKISMKHIFSYKPKIIFHAAAYKHVPLMEKNPREAILTNIEGTKILAELAIENSAEKFVFISTDKAVNPISIMGSTKKVAENMLRCIEKGKPKFVSVRFGNVLESRGSVVPIFKEQIKNRRPITITHPDMERYFMSIAEAVQLVLQAGTMGAGGEIFILDMGKPVKILDLAKEMIQFYGLIPDKDIPIIFTGIRPGEKLTERLFSEEEGIEETQHNKILAMKSVKHVDNKYMLKIENVIDIAKENKDEKKIAEALYELLAGCKSENS